jgi:exosortase/archaeosortase family protein
LGLWALVCALPDSFAKAVCEHTARILGDVLNAFGYPVSVAGNVVADSGISFQIVLECTALSVVAIFACFVSSYRTQGRKKLLGLAMGIPALYLGNLVRLVSIFVVTRHDPSLFEIIHVYMGQVFTLILVALGCIVWLKWVDRDPSAGPVVRIAGFFARLVVISGCMFLFWMEVHHGYVWLLDRLMIFGFSLFNYQLFIPRETAVYYETFSIVAFTSLVLATGSTSWPSKAKGLAIGLGLFVLLHLFHRTNNALVSAFHFTSLLQLDIFLCDVGQYLLPIVLWVLVAAGRLPRKTKSPDPLSSHGQRVEHVAVK